MGVFTRRAVIAHGKESYNRQCVQTCRSVLAAVSAFLFFADALRHGGSVYHRAFEGVASTTAVSIGSQVMQEQRFQLCGFSREIALIDYGITNDTEKFVTEICIPVRPAQADAL